MEFFAGLLILGVTGIIKAIYNSFKHPVDYHYIAPFIRSEYGQIHILAHHPMSKYWHYFFAVKCKIPENQIFMEHDVPSLIHVFRAGSLYGCQHGFICWEDGTGYSNMTMEDRHVMYSVMSFEEQENMYNMYVDKARF